MVPPWRLAISEREALDNLPRNNRPHVCDISLWEVALLIHGGRLQLALPLEAWLTTATAKETVRGKHFERYQRHVRIIQLGEDLAARYPDAEAVMAALRRDAATAQRSS